MAFVLQHLPYFLLLAILLAVSAAFSGSEAILFSLSRHDRLRMKKSKNRLEVLAAELMDDPRSLLTTLMIGNMSCNVLIYVISTMLLEHVGVAGGKGWVAALVLVPSLMVTYVSDVFPKVVGSLNNLRLAPLIALPVATLIRLTWPVSRVIDAAVLRPVHRLVSGGKRAGKREGEGGEGGHRGAGFSVEELQEMLEMSEDQGVIDVSENELLQEVVRIGEMRVRDVMTPRVDVLAFHIKDAPEKLLELFAKSHLTKAPVYEGEIDNLIGLVYAKDFFLERDAQKVDVRRLLKPIQFVPEYQTLDRLIGRFRQTRAQLAAVVDEFGGFIGIVTLEDVVEQMVGDIYEPHDVPGQAVEKVGPGEYRVAGDLSIVDWEEAFGLEGTKVEGRISTSTVAGLLATLLNRIPRLGDQVRVGHIVMTVEGMHGKRVDKVRLKLVGEGEVRGSEVRSSEGTGVTIRAWMWPIAAGGAMGAVAGWYVLAGVALVATAIFSGAEIGILSLSRVRLRLRTHRGEPAALEVARWLEQPTYALEGLLVLQNICSFGFSAAVTAIMEGLGYGQALQVILSTVIITPMILVLSEIMPKDLFHTHADQWVYKLVPMLKKAFWLITVAGILPAVRGLSKASTWVVQRGRPERELAGPRAEILQLFQESAATGVMSGTQQDLVQRALRMGRVTIREVMIPWSRVVGVPAGISRDGFAAVVKHYTVSRMPVLGRTTTEVLGIVDILDALGERGGFDLSKHLHPAMTLIGEQSVRSAITLMQRARQTIGVVVDRQGRAIGLVTMKDLIEELVGDLENW